MTVQPSSTDIETAPSAKLLLDTMEAMEPAEQADVDFLLERLGMAPIERNREIVHSFRRQVICVAAHEAGILSNARPSEALIDDPKMCLECYGDGYFPKADLTGDLKCEACNGAGSRGAAQAAPTPRRDAYEVGRHIIGYLEGNCGLSFVDLEQDDWDTVTNLVATLSLPAHPTQGGNKGEAVAWRWRMRSATNPDHVGFWEFKETRPNIPADLQHDCEPLFAAPQPASSAYEAKEPTVDELGGYIEHGLAYGISTKDGRSAAYCLLHHFDIRAKAPINSPEQDSALAELQSQSGINRSLSESAPKEGVSITSTHQSSPAATIGDIPSEPRPPASAAMGLSAGGVTEIAAAKAFLREKPSTSYLQRKMQITYNHALRLITALENEGFISIPDSQGRRTILLTSTPRGGEA